MLTHDNLQRHIYRHQLSPSRVLRISVGGDCAGETWPGDSILSGGSPASLTYESVFQSVAFIPDY